MSQIIALQIVSNLLTCQAVFHEDLLVSLRCEGLCLLIGTATRELKSDKQQHMVHL